MRPARSKGMVINYLPPRQDKPVVQSADRARREAIRKRLAGIRNRKELREILSEPWDL